MTKIIWTHHKDCSYGYLLSDVSYIDNKGRYVFEDTTEYPYDYTRIDAIVKTVISQKSVITTITDASTNEIRYKKIDRIVSIEIKDN